MFRIHQNSVPYQLDFERRSSNFYSNMEALTGMAAPAPALSLGKWPSHSRSHLRPSSMRSFSFTQVPIIHTLSYKGRRKSSKRAVGGGAEKSLRSTIEMDRLIDKLRVTNEQKKILSANKKFRWQRIEIQVSLLAIMLRDDRYSNVHHALPEIVAENILAFDSAFWMRLAARTELCESLDDKEDFEDLAFSLMSMVDRVVQKTEEKIESATDVLKAILKPITNEDEEIVWPPRDPESIILMKKELVQRDQEGQLDETFLSEVNAQLGQAKIDDDKPGLVAILQKVLQIYASKVLSRRSYAEKGEEIIKAEEFLEAIIKADEESWNRLLISGLMLGGGSIMLEEFNSVIEKRLERTLMRTLSGSYQQRVLCEYLKEIKARAKDLVQAFQNQQF